ncbi:GNAT family N-acetyltransferase [Roseovarius spongiae]|uniref:GNAT family N-acetyltransferase n=1 Tax=Roseovarius spongiae TaxID=2320272 RepID=A0A3A8B9B9_9RHOB|nr:GNAT family N-acetyltransferase [Roseovarius spongiae]RKF14703.1 GNAT family N-acetyltransferase [Roseovarius spongiae]
MTELRFRLAERADAARLNAALAQLSDALNDPHRATDDDLARAGWGANPVFRAILAEDADGEVAGAALYSPLMSTSRGMTMVFVSDLWLAPARRGSGLGRRLLGAVCRDARAAWGAQAIKLAVYHSSEGARAFYDRLGFRPASGATEMVLDPEKCKALEANG